MTRPDALEMARATLRHQAEIALEFGNVETCIGYLEATLSLCNTGNRQIDALRRTVLKRTIRELNNGKAT